jgi:hypothetical protein
MSMYAFGYSHCDNPCNNEIILLLTDLKRLSKLRSVFCRFMITHCSITFGNNIVIISLIATKVSDNVYLERHAINHNHSL